MGLNWRNTRSWGRSLLVVRSPSLWSDAGTARRLCLFCEAEQKACLFVLGLCQMWETWVLYNVNFPAVLKYANQGGKGVVFAVSMFPPMWYTYSGNVLSWEKGMVRHSLCISSAQPLPSCRALQISVQLPQTVRERQGYFSCCWRVFSLRT